MGLPMADGALQQRQCLKLKVVLKKMPYTW